LKNGAKKARSQKPWGYFGIPIGILLLLKVVWPLRNIALVCWVRGSGAYNDGIRVLRGKPTRFSDGQLVPNLPDFVTGLMAFFVAMLAAMLIVWFFSQVYDKCFSRNAD
jgi:hypothetical protein